MLAATPKRTFRRRPRLLRNPLIFERARFRRFSAVRPDAERTNRLTRALISRQRPSKIKNPTELIPYRGHFQSLCLTPGCKTPAAKNEGMAEDSGRSWRLAKVAIPRNFLQSMRPIVSRK